MSDSTRLTRLPATVATSLTGGASRVGQGAVQTAITVHQHWMHLDEQVASGVRRGFEAAATHVLARPATTATTPLPANAPNHDFTTAARRVFDRVDSSHNGFLSRQEIANAMGDHAYTGADGAAVATLNDQHNALENLADDERGPEMIGVSRADLDALDRLPADHAVSKAVNNRFANSQRAPMAVNRELFPSGVASITASAVNQGRAGDCYFLAALAGVADTNPESLQRMIHDNGNGTFTVDFPRGGPITVSAPTEAELGSYGTGNQHGLWVSVIEKAFAELRNQRRLNFYASDYDAASGGFGRDGIRTLTGSSVTSLPTRALTDRQLLSRISAAQRENRAIAGAVSLPSITIQRRQVAGVSIPLPHVADDRNGFPDRHVYTVQGVTDDGKIRIRNPWGTGGPQGNGVHELTPGEFRRTVDFISIQDHR